MAYVSDNFNRANGAVGSNWTGMTNGTFSVSGNTLVHSNNGGHLIWTTSTLISTNHYAQARVASLSTNRVGPAVRCNASSQNGYALTVKDGALQINDVAYGSGNPFIQCGSVAVGDVVRLEAEGATLRAYKNGTLVGSYSSAAYFGGVPGIQGEDYGTTAIDDWEGGDLPLSVSRTVTSPYGFAGSTGSAPSAPHTWVAPVNSVAGAVYEWTNGLKTTYVKRIITTIVALLNASGKPENLQVTLARKLTSMPQIAVYPMLDSPAMTDAQPLRRQLNAQVRFRSAVNDMDNETLRGWALSQILADPTLGGLVLSIEHNTDWTGQTSDEYSEVPLNLVIDYDCSSTLYI